MSVSAIPPAWLSIPERGPIAEILRARGGWLEDHRGVRPASQRLALRDLVDAGRNEEAIRRGYIGRFGMELLQNAHDAMAAARHKGIVRFIVTDTALLVSNEGQPFDASRVESITRLNSSDKPSRRSSHRQIGYKGIGFTSVFEISDTPQILSQTVGFQFDRSRATALVGEHLGIKPDGPMPARYFPLPVGEEDVAPDRIRIQELFDAGAATVIRLPLRADRSRVDVIAHLRATIKAETLLFTPAVLGIVVAGDAAIASWNRRLGHRLGTGRVVHLDSAEGRTRSWLLSSARVPVPPELGSAITDELWQGVTSIDVAAAIPWSRRGPAADVEPQPVYSYFPTDDALGRSILLHGDFYLDSTRTRLDFRGQGAGFTELATAAAVDVASRLSETVAHWGRPLLRLLSPIGAPDGGGQVLARRLDERLREARIVRTFGGCGPLTAPETRDIPTDLDTPQAQRLIALMRPNDDLLDPEDAKDGVRSYLTSLGMTSLGMADVARRIDPTVSSDPYGSILGLLEAWLAAAPFVDSDTIEALRERRVVQDESGIWTTAGRVERRVEGAPAMPARLRRPELLEPGNPQAARFVGRLRIAVLDPAAAIDRLVDAINDGTYGQSKDERVAAINLAFAVWSAAPAVFGSRAARIGVIAVLARTAHARVERTWCRADHCYFGRDWTDDRTLEELYGTFGEAEFLGEQPPTNAMERTRRRAFYTALGVASSPRKHPLDSVWTSEAAQWRATNEYRAASACPDGHTGSGRAISGWAIDRLDELLDGINEGEQASRFARGLLLLDEPYGPAATIACTHSSHVRDVRKPVVGYQRWRLQKSAWVPVANDPSGQDRQVPSRAWAGVPRTSPWLQVPHARLKTADALRLDLVSFERPPARALEQALRALAASYPELATSPQDIRETAAWLLRRLETTSSLEPSADPPALPSVAHDGLRWSKTPVVPNVPGLPRIEGLDLLPSGRWRHVARAYGLRLATEVATANITRGPRRRQPPLLPHRRRIELLAMLRRDFGEDARLAGRIGGIIETTVDWLAVAWWVGGDVTEAPDLGFFLAPRRDRLDRVIGAELVISVHPRPDRIELAHALADYIEVADAASEIAIFLEEPDRMLDRLQMSEAELADAAVLLGRQRRYRAAGGRGDTIDEDQGEAEADPLNPEGWEPPPLVEIGAGAWEEPPAKEYVDVAQVHFGPVRKPATGNWAPAPSQPGRGRRRASNVDRRMPIPEPATGRGEDDSVASARQSERVAIDLVVRYGRGLPGIVGVRDVQDDDKGWDLEFVRSDGSYIPVEVKGSSGTANFTITENEWAAAKAEPDYTLFHVVNLAVRGDTRMRRYRNLGDRLTWDQLSASAWTVSGWRDLDPDEIPALSD